MLDLYEPDIHWLAKLSDVINFEIPAEVAEGIPLLFSGVTVPTGIDKESLWRYIQMQYGEHRLLWDYNLQNNGLSPAHGHPYRYLPRVPKITQALIAIFDANQEKYKRLLLSLEASYDPLQPYNIMIEEASGNLSAKVTSVVGSHTDTQSETSMDSTTQQPAYETVVGSHTDTVEGEHNKSITFEGEAYLTGMDSVAGLKNRKKGNLGNLSYQDLIEKEVKNGIYSLYDIIAKDITDMICYKLFASC